MTELDQTLRGVSEKWPKVWALGSADIIPFSKALVAQMKPFIRHLYETGLKQKTIERYLDNLWVIGCETAHRLRNEPELRETASLKSLLEDIESGESELQEYADAKTRRKSLETTFRRLLRFLRSR